MPQNGRRQGRRSQRTTAFRVARAAFTFVVGVAGPIGLAITVHQVYLSKPVTTAPQGRDAELGAGPAPAADGTAGPTGAAETPAGRSAAGPPAGPVTAPAGSGPVAGGPDAGGPDAGGPDAGGPDAGGWDTARPDAGGRDAGVPDAAGPGDLPPAAGRSGSGGTRTDRVASGDSGHREPAAPSPAPPAAPTTATTPATDAGAEPCRWKVRWRSVGIYRSPVDPEPVTYATRNQVLTGDCRTVTGSSRRPGRASEVYYRVDAGRDPDGTPLPAGYVLAESLVTALP
ncbi:MULTISPECIES: hypothetical protein [Catenuloplanes]|uniref:Uncharacterized protein n=1 Tax=Catenuloplanes niger TaxID=587534 RepID=A0AAE3ZYN9_9ACTN|nr:hypothetical protein [Catenuloplanes niger]MDR7326205.1 hypothetical protein [Catenuloplanes niger]